MKRSSNLIFLLILGELIIGTVVLGFGIAKTMAGEDESYVIVRSEQNNSKEDASSIESIPTEAPEEYSEPSEEVYVYGKEVDEFYQNMTADERISQLFAVTLEDITGVKAVTVAGNRCKEAIVSAKPGAVVLSTKNLLGAAATKENLKNLQAYSVEACGLELILFNNLVQSGVATAQMGELAIAEGELADTLSHGIPEGNDILFGELKLSFVGEGTSAGENAIDAINAGANYVYVRSGFEQAFDYVKKAYEEGIIAEETVYDSVCENISYKLFN